MKWPAGCSSGKKRATPGGKAKPEAAASEAVEDGDRITVQLAQVALIPPAKKLLLVTADGAIWEQLDSEPVHPTPKPGESMQIRRNSFGGYFCKFDKYTSVRCERKH